MSKLAIEIASVSSGRDRFLWFRGSGYDALLILVPFCRSHGQFKHGGLFLESPGIFKREEQINFSKLEKISTSSQTQ